MFQLEAVIKSNSKVDTNDKIHKIICFEWFMEPISLSKKKGEHATRTKMDFEQSTGWPGGATPRTWRHFIWTSGTLYFVLPSEAFVMLPVWVTTLRTIGLIAFVFDTLLFQFFCSTGSFSATAELCKAIVRQIRGTFYFVSIIGATIIRKAARGKGIYI